MCVLCVLDLRSALLAREGRVGDRWPPYLRVALPAVDAVWPVALVRRPPDVRASPRGVRTLVCVAWSPQDWDPPTARVCGASCAVPPACGLAGRPSALLPSSQSAVYRREPVQPLLCERRPWRSAALTATSGEPVAPCPALALLPSSALLCCVCVAAGVPGRAPPRACSRPAPAASPLTVRPSPPLPPRLGERRSGAASPNSAERRAVRPADCGRLRAYAGGESVSVRDERVDNRARVCALPLCSADTERMRIAWPKIMSAGAGLPKRPGSWKAATRSAKEWVGVSGRRPTLVWACLLA